jgi:putative spermidine/putrescine transport system permease protein
VSSKTAAASAPARRRRSRRVRPARLLLGLFSGLTAIWLLAPVAVLVPLSFTDRQSFKFPPDGLSTRWWDGLINDPSWERAITNSVVIALCVVVLSVALGTAAALGLTRGRFPGLRAANALLLLPLVIPLVVTGAGIYGVFLEWHLVGTTFGFVVAHTVLAVPLVIVTVTASLRGFDRDLEIAAASLGASPLATFFKVTLPLIRPGVLAGAALALITSFDELVIALFIASPLKRTLPVQMFTQLDVINPTVAAAATLIVGVTVALSMVLIVVRRRQIDDA